MGFQVKIFVLASLMILCLLCSFEATVAGVDNSSQQFPLPDELKPSVEFWKNVYGVYSQNQVIIHDDEHLDIIYAVVNFDSLFKGVNVSERIKWKRIERIRKDYQKILRNLAKKRNLNIESLQGQEKAVALLFKDNLTPKALRAAAKRIREQSGIREEFKRGLQRSGLYYSKITEVFRREGLPVELAALPHVESSFNYKAYSKFGAAGIWQFTRSTGRAYMKINYSVDERFDPISATESAAQLLKKNYEVLGSWPLAITAYNHGRAGMKRAQSKYGQDIVKIIKKYRSRSFGFASRNFYAEFLAALYVSRHYKQYFGDIEFHRISDFVVFRTPDYVTVKNLISKLNIDLQTFAEFNPALRKPVLQSRRRIPKYFRIRIPYKENINIEEVYAQISSQYKYDEQINPDWHKVHRGENLSGIARQYHVTVRDLMALNDLKNAHRIYVGQNLQIPSLKQSWKPVKRNIKRPPKNVQLAEAPDLKKGEKSVMDVPAVPTEGQQSQDKTSPAGEDYQKKIKYIPAKTQLSFTNQEIGELQPSHSVAVQQIDDNKYESVENIMAMALPDYYVEMTRDNGSRVVKVPRIEMVHEMSQDIAFPENGQVVVEPDETLGHFADWLNVPTQKLRRINGLSFRQSIHIGQPLWLTFERLTPEEFHRRRIEYHQGIEEDFYRNYTVSGEKTHKIKWGENIWYLCNSVYELPYWLFKKYNPNRNLLQLAAGEEVVIPVVEKVAP